MKYDDIEKRALSATPGPLMPVHYANGEDPTQPATAVELHERLDEHMKSGGTWFYGVQGTAQEVHREQYEPQGYDLKRGITVAWTGNGPQSAANAEFFAHAAEDVLMLVRRCRALEAERTAIQNDERVLTCAFCGHEYPPGTPTSNHEGLTKHVFECPEHPAAAALKVVRDLVAEIDAQYDAECGIRESMREYPDHTFNLKLDAQVILDALAAMQVTG